MAEEVKKPIGTKPAEEAGAEDIMQPMMTMLVMVVMISMIGNLFGGVDGVDGEENGGVETAYGRNLTATFSPEIITPGETLTIDVRFEYRGGALPSQMVAAYLASHRKQEDIYDQIAVLVDLPESPDDWTPVSGQLQIVIPASPPEPDQGHEVYIVVLVDSTSIVGGWFDDAFTIVMSEVKELVGEFF